MLKMEISKNSIDKRAGFELLFEFIIILVKQTECLVPLAISSTFIPLSTKN